jgi:uncharacterized protein
VTFPASDIRIDIDGLWFYSGMEMSRRDIVRLFYRSLRKDESGRYLIEIGKQRYPVDVEDTAFVVWTLDWIDGGDGSEECIRLLLSDDSIEPLDPDTLRIRRDGIPYCSVKNGSFDARFSRSSYYRLAERVQYDPLRKGYFISLKKRRYYIVEEGR